MSFIKYGVENLGIVFKKNDCKKLIKEFTKQEILEIFS